MQVVPGAADRQGSGPQTRSQALPPEFDVVLVHDAARPLVPVDLVEEVVAAVRAGAPAVPSPAGLPLSDTVKRVDAYGIVVETPDRASLRGCGRPLRGSPPSLLPARRMPAAAARGFRGDRADAALVEALGLAVRIVPGSPDALSR